MNDIHIKEFLFNFCNLKFLPAPELALKGCRFRNILIKIWYLNNLHFYPPKYPQCIYHIYIIHIVYIMYIIYIYHKYPQLYPQYIYNIHMVYLMYIIYIINRWRYLLGAPFIWRCPRFGALCRPKLMPIFCAQIFFPLHP